VKPFVLVPACNRMVGDHPFHIAGKKYLDAVRLAGCQGFVVPSLDAADFEDVLDAADGVFLTGSPSNVHPSNFDEPVHNAELPLDVMRDEWTLPLIPKILARGIPLFAICRGFQETNVALGGSLHQAVQEVPGRQDHRGAKGAPAEVQYAPAHPVQILPGGEMQRILGSGSIQVNSVHGQGVNRLAEGLRVEAVAPDGQIEAFTVNSAQGFNLCVQWHPEWQAASNPVSMQLLQAFGAACEAYRSARGRSLRGDRHRAHHPEPDR
jgi:putative glutamine amidotransferase